MKALGIIILLCFVLIFVVLTILCHIIALVTNYWLQSSSPGQNNFLNIGLFVACFDGYEHKHDKIPRTYDGCHNIDSDYYDTIQDWLEPSWLVACRAVAFIALILQLVGAVFVLILLLWWFCKWMCCDNKRACCERCLIYATPILFIIAGMFLMCAVMIFGDNAFRLQCKDFWVGGGDPNTNYLAWSWGVEVAACVFSFLAGGFIIWLAVEVIKTREDEV